MNMPRRPDEDELWAAFGTDGEPYRTIEEAYTALGISPRRAYYLSNKWDDKGLIMIGSFWWLAQKTPKGREEGLGPQ